jgi:hypothetical protein
LGKPGKRSGNLYALALLEQATVTVGAVEGEPTVTVAGSTFVLVAKVNVPTRTGADSEKPLALTARNIEALPK